VVRSRSKSDMVSLATGVRGKGGRKGYTLLDDPEKRLKHFRNRNTREGRYGAREQVSSMRGQGMSGIRVHGKKQTRPSTRQTTQLQSGGKSQYL